MWYPSKTIVGIGDCALRTQALNLLDAMATESIQVNTISCSCLAQSSIAFSTALARICIVRGAEKPQYLGAAISACARKGEWTQVRNKGENGHGITEQTCSHRQRRVSQCFAGIADLEPDGAHGSCHQRSCIKWSRQRVRESICMARSNGPSSSRQAHVSTQHGPS